MLTRKNTIATTGNNCRVVSSFLLILFCLFRMERYGQVSLHPTIHQRPATEQVETVRPDYRIPVLSERPDVHPVTVSTCTDNGTSFFGALFALLEHEYSLAATLRQRACSAPAPDPFGFLIPHRTTSSSNDSDLSPATA